MSDGESKTAENASPADVPAHERVFLVVVDDSEEMRTALHFACRRAKTSGGRIALLHVQEPADFQHWMAVGEIMREEQREEAEELLQVLSAEVHNWSGKIPSFYMREGDRREEVVKLIDEEPSISILVLGAGAGRRGPGPIVEHILGRGAGQLCIPITLVPGILSDEDVLAIT